MSNNTFNFSVSGSRGTSNLRSHNLFDLDYQEPNKSPIDLYEDNMLGYKKLWGCFLLDTSNNEYISLASTNGAEWSKLSNLLVLGFISSVESYVRCTLRKLLLIDEPSKLKSYSKTITYAAATYHDSALMPEALMEDCSFHSADNIKKTIKEITNISLNNTQKYPELNSAFINYDFIGQLRHCIVHRSGLFGSNNALSLGINEYGSFLEKPIKMDLVVIQKAASVCDALVRELNDIMFCEILSRTIETYDWKGDFESDKEFFNTYFELFSSQEMIDKKIDCYNNFVTSYNLQHRPR
ncbi:hypothetical protein [Photobacterium phosphoreum]|uniref:hypothetical protein n=1 Tax=Photobacterium phosphoreum TaxID=659 RepID=UPI0039AEEBA8